MRSQGKKGGYLFDERGFSLIELMVVVSIITLITSLTLPLLTGLKIKAAQAEAMANLPLIYTLEKAYHAEHSEYIVLQHGNFPSPIINNGAPLNPSSCMDVNAKVLGFTLKDCIKSRYFYSVSTGIGAGMDEKTEFLAEALSSSMAVEYSGLPFWTLWQYGNPVTYCHNPAFSDKAGFFHDSWTMDQDKVLTKNFDIYQYCTYSKLGIFGSP